VADGSSNRLTYLLVDGENLDAILARDADVALVSHDADFETHLRALLPDRRVAVLGFREYVSQRLAELEPLGLQFFDMESAVGAFNVPLPRVRVIPLDEFDPEHFLS
jgi:uncharacterized protein